MGNLILASRRFAGNPIGTARTGFILVVMPDDLQTRIVGILEKISKQPVRVGSDESLFDSGLLDSFALPDMVSALEQEFGISVPDSDLTPRKFESIDSIGRYIESRTS